MFLVEHENKRYLPFQFTKVGAGFDFFGASENFLHLCF
jgi:hypothetical protein